MAGELLLRAEKICKNFGPTRALKEVDIEVYRGDVRGLIGENGSGKSTFSSIAAGVQMADSGCFTMKGKDYKPANMVDAQNHGISMIVQEMGTISGITVGANIFAGRLEEYARFGIVDFKAINRKANEILDGIGAADIRAEQMVAQLNFEDRKIVEIARAMVCNPDLLIVDETTTALAQKGRGILYKLIERFQKENKAVLFISHDLDELMEICNCITVLRDGELIQNLSKEEMSIDRMRSLMVGRELTDDYFRTDFTCTYEKEVLLSAEHITQGILEDVSLELHKGEILGLGGLSASGMHELGRVLYGLDKPLTGTVKLSQKGVEVKNPQTAVKNNMAYVSKERDREAIVLSGSIQENIEMPSLPYLGNKFGFIRNGKEKELADREIEHMRIKCRNGRQKCAELSGGNKQKVVFSKWLAKESDIFILDCPTRGIDVGVKAYMYQLMMELKKQGKAIVMISEELPELIGMSDRILIMKNGHISGELRRSKELNEKSVISFII